MTESSETKASIVADESQKKDTAASLFNMRRELMCSICYENYNQLALKPVSLVPCGHSVCSRCVEKLEKKTCPTCKEPFTIHIFNWAIIGLLPKPTVDEIKSQVRRSIDDNAELIGEVERLSKLTCFETVRKDIEDKYTELTNDLLTQKRELLSKINSAEKKYGIKLDIVEKAQKDLKQYHSELSKSNEISECRLTSMIKMLQLDLEQLQDCAKNLKQISSEPPVVRFRPHGLRMLNMIGELICEPDFSDTNSITIRRRSRIPDVIGQTRESHPFNRFNSFLRNSNFTTSNVNGGFSHIRRRTNGLLDEVAFPPSDFLLSLRNRPTESTLLARRDSGEEAW